MTASMTTETELFPRDIAALPEVAPPATIDLADGDELQLTITPVRKRIGDEWVRLLSYNGSVPGPTLRIAQGARVSVRVQNSGDGPTTVHWHGLRLDNRSDGTLLTQEPIAIGESFVYGLEVPDPGAYWYHPHIREDHGQEMGLYGSIVVVPSQRDYWPPAHRELPLTLDDLLIEDGRIAPFSRREISHVAMGRFGNTMLVAGETDLAWTARLGEVVRLYLTNTANTRVFAVTLPGARMKLVGGDSGRVEEERLVDDVLLAPSERVVVDVLFERAGVLELQHRTPERSYRLAGIKVTDEAASPGPAEQFHTMRRNPEWAAERRRLQPLLAAAPDKTLAFVAEMEVPTASEGDVYSCPMHPDVISETAGKCPLCGMKLLPGRRAAASGHGHHGHHDHGPGHQMPTRAPLRIEWEDDMVEVNRASTPANMRWQLIDRASGAVNGAIDWRFRVGDRIKIRLVNEEDSDHPMPHPFHIHGAGRFVVVARDGVAEANLVWKDTVLVRTGETVDLVLEVTHPGRWMAHCHIAEHHEAGMMFAFDVAPEA